MSSGDKSSAFANPTLTAGHSLVFWRRFWLTLASLWCTGTVIVFVVLEIKHWVQTPIGDWLPRILRLLGLR